MARTLHCCAEGGDGDWEAICLDLDVAVQGRSLEEVFDGLKEAISLYLQTVADLPREERPSFLYRPVPFLVRLNGMTSGRPRRADQVPPPTSASTDARRRPFGPNIAVGMWQTEVAAMAEPAVQPVNVAAFLEGDDATDTRCELIDGRPRTMAPLVAAGGAAPFQSPKIVNASRQGLRLEDERADG